MTQHLDDYRSAAVYCNEKNDNRIKIGFFVSVIDYPKKFDFNISNNRHQSIGPKPDCRPRLEGARYKYLTSCSCGVMPAHPSVTHTFAHIIKHTPPLLG